MRCNCESCFCQHHGGNIDAVRERGATATCDPCTYDADGAFTMDRVGVVCAVCAAVNIANKAGSLIHGPRETLIA